MASLENFVKDTVIALAIVLLMVAGVVAVVWLIVDDPRDSDQKNGEYAAWRHELIVAQKQSPAHQYLVYHWLNCGWRESQTSCFAGIHESARVLRGDKFAQEVAVAAKDLKLIN